MNVATLSLMANSTREIDIQIEELDGYWEIDFGGCLFIAVSPESDIDIVRALYDREPK